MIDNENISMNRKIDWIVHLHDTKCQIVQEIAENATRITPNTLGAWYIGITERANSNRVLTITWVVKFHTAILVVDADTGIYLIHIRQVQTANVRRKGNKGNI
jgi:hypothetical protein